MPVKVETMDVTIATPADGFISHDGQAAGLSPSPLDRHPQPLPRQPKTGLKSATEDDDTKKTPAAGHLCNHEPTTRVAKSPDLLEPRRKLAILLNPAQESPNPG